MQWADIAGAADMTTASHQVTGGAAPLYDWDYGYWPDHYGDYAYGPDDPNCYRTSRYHTRTGWHTRRVDVCQ